MKKAGIALVAILILTSVLIVPVVYARKHQVTVRVINTDNKGKEKKISGAVVEITDPPQDPPKEAATDEKGRAFLKGLAPDTTYTIKVTDPDGATEERTFTTDKNGAAPLQTVDFG